MTGMEQFKRITHIRDEFIEEAYLPASSGAVPTVRKDTAAYRFFHSGWWVAILCSVFSVTLLMGLVMLGRNGGLLGPVSPPISTDTNTDTDTATDTDTDTTTDTDTEEPTERNETIELQARIHSPTVKAGETVEVSIQAIIPAELEWEPRFSVYLTYGTVPVSKDVLAFEGIATDDPTVFTVPIPENAPAGQYDLAVICEEAEQTEVFGQVLSVQTADKFQVNPHLWLTHDENVIYPYKWEFASRNVTIRHTTPDYDQESWYIVYSDGVGFIGNSQVGVESLPTVVYNDNLILHYADHVLSNGRYAELYDDREEFLQRIDPMNISSDLDKLESGTYYLVMFGFYMGIDHTQEVLEAAKVFDEEANAEWGWEATYFQDDVNAAIMKDPLYFTDIHYCQHIVRIIIP